MSGIFFGPAGSPAPTTAADLERFTPLPGVESWVLHPWQRTALDAFREHGPNVVLSHPRGFGRRRLALAAEALTTTGAPMPENPDIRIRIEVDATSMRTSFFVAARAFETFAAAMKVSRRRRIEQQRIERAMRIVARRAARHQRRAASRAARGVAR